MQGKTGEKITLSMRRAGSLSSFRGQWNTAKPPKVRPHSISSRLRAVICEGVSSASSFFQASAMTLHRHTNPSYTLKVSIIPLSCSQACSPSETTRP